MNIKQKWSKEEIATLIKYYPITSLNDMLGLLPNKNKKSIIYKANTLKIKNINLRNQCGWSKIWTPNEDKIMYDMYGKVPIHEIQKTLKNRSIQGIQQRAQKLGLKYLVYNKNYFDCIDTREKAYWLGFISADGCVSTQNRFMIEVQSRDKQLLEKFVDCLHSNIIVRERVRNGHGLCSIAFKNSTLYNDLVSKGIVKNKTLSLKFPLTSIIQNDFMCDYIRGFFDGDGCYFFKEYSRNKNVLTKMEISAVSASKEFLVDLQKWLLNTIHCESIIMLQKRKDRDCAALWNLRIFKKSEMIKFINYVFYDGCICLDRKKQKANNILKYCLARQKCRV